MGSLPFAFSVHHFINSVGSDAGFASIIGLAILILLYFAQARETSNLRDHAHEAAQRIQDLEARLAQVGRNQPAPEQRQPTQPPVRPAQPAAVRPASASPIGVGASQGASQADPAAAAASLPIAPAGVGAPALTAATKLIPTPSPAAAAPAASHPPDATVIGAAPAVAAPSTVAGAANGVGGEQAVRPAPRPVSAPTVGSPPPRIQIRPGATTPPTRRPVPPQRTGSGEGRRGLRILLAVGGLLVLAGVIALLVVLTSGSGSSASTSASSQASTTNAPSTSKKRARGNAVTPSSVTVAVLNGTATSGLAHRVALKLGGAGYKQGAVATATDQTKTSTTVAFLPGFRRDALAVATSLKLGASAVAPVDQPTQAVACPPPNSCTDNVIVTVGSDLANTQ